MPLLANQSINQSITKKKRLAKECVKQVKISIFKFNRRNKRIHQKTLSYVVNYK